MLDGAFSFTEEFAYAVSLKCVNRIRMLFCKLCKKRELKWLSFKNLLLWSKQDLEVFLLAFCRRAGFG